MQEENGEQFPELTPGQEELHEKIAMRAYEIYQQRGGEPGSDLEDWLQAENEVLKTVIAEESQIAAEASAT